ncbi:glycoside hydrolase [Sedimenticola sp.]|uniref:glycoside hydrolase n=1 Tax=Sedimenticola sp. TaxID=1940285 RepID=UPI003D0A1670
MNVVLYWHMHQPDYRDQRNGEYQQPWTYLHTIKDYVDMVAHLENNPAARAVVNFAPILLEQIDDYACQLEDYLHHGKALRDQLLSALIDPVLYLDTHKRLKLIKSCLRANRYRLIERYPLFKTLADLGQNAVKDPETLAYYSEQFFIDLLVWYHLAWLGETVRRKDERVKSLMERAGHYTMHDRHLLIELMHELISGVIGRYRRLAENGRIELSMTPYAHPMLPLLINFDVADQSQTEIQIPLSSQYPGGLERCRWHIEQGQAVFKKMFGFVPAGCWPSEGGVSAECLELLADMGIKWVASGETVLRHSLDRSGSDPVSCIHDAYTYKERDMACFFRDDGLSDLIGFSYSDWHADDAVANLLHHLEGIAKSCADVREPVVSIIMDGENAWEHYPENGYHFLTALYERLANHSRIRLTTYSEYLGLDQVSKINLDQIVAGSWVYGNFSTWIGEKDKNRAWDMLVEAKKTYDRVIGSGILSEQRCRDATLQLATCESSDWFWWLGDYNSAESVAMFDELFRLHLSNLYQLLEVESPDYLTRAFSVGTGSPAMGGAMRPGRQP